MMHQDGDHGSQYKKTIYVQKKINIAKAIAEKVLEDTKKDSKNMTSIKLLTADKKERIRRLLS